jgi:hypothetical protein
MKLPENRYPIFNDCEKHWTAQNMSVVQRHKHPPQHSQRQTMPRPMLQAGLSGGHLASE